MLLVECPLLMICYGLRHPMNMIIMSEAADQTGVFCKSPIWTLPTFFWGVLSVRKGGELALVTVVAQAALQRRIMLRTLARDPAAGEEKVLPPKVPSIRSVQSYLRVCIFNSRGHVHAVRQ